MTTLIQNSNETVRSAVCLALAILIVGAGLMLGSAGIDAVFHSALAAVPTQFA